MITEVTPGSPADKAELKAGDVGTAMDGKKVSTSGDLVRLINSYKVGQKVEAEITYWHRQAKSSASLILGDGPPPEF
jgi:S1-C subfamily serine protease